MKKKIFLLFIFLLLISSNLSALTKGENLLKSIDELFELKTDAKALVKIIQFNEDQGTKIYEMLWYRRDKDDAFLLAYTLPVNERGNGVLQKKDNIWLYRSNTRSFQHIKRTESLLGTDAKAGDFEKKKFYELYKIELNNEGKELIEDTMLAKFPVFKATLVSTAKDVDYPKKQIWFRQDNYLPLKIQSYSLSGALMITEYFLEYINIADRFVSVKQMIIDEFDKKNKCIFEITKISTDLLDDNIFTKGYLENLSK